MFKPKLLVQAVALALILPGVSYAEFEISGEAKIEYSVFTSDGLVTGAEEEHEAGDAMKAEPSIKLFINSDVGEESAFHAELLLADDSEAASERLEGGEESTQYEVLREFYFDTNGGGWDLRLGKQQVVWGTADGIKLLDIINPTDYRELNQNVTEDARIPVWMINAERELDNGGNIQVIISEAQPNFISGLDADGDSGAPFIFKGLDTITGKTDGFLNIIPKLTGVATSFTMGAVNNMFGAADMNGDGLTDGLVPFAGMSVDTFASQGWTFDGSQLTPDMTPIPQGSTDNVQNFPNFNGDGFVLLNAIAQQGLMTLMGSPVDPYGNHSETNLMNEDGDPWTMAAPTDTTVTWDVRSPKSAFEYMPNASFATFNNSAGNLWLAQNMLTPIADGGQGMTPADFGVSTEQEVYAMFHGPAQSDYIVEDTDGEANFGFRFKNTTGGGLNYSLNYFYGYSHNPSVNMICRDSVTGEQLQHELRRPNNPNANPNYSDTFATVITEDQVSNSYDGTIGVAFNEAGQYYGAFNPMTGGLAAFGDATHSTNGIVMVFEETYERTQNLGFSFDNAIDTDALGSVVFRGEFLYTQDEPLPVIDKRLLAIGYMPEAMKTEGHDMFKFVLGADVTVMTNLLVSTQLIQFHNLDYVDEQRTCTTAFGTEFDCSRYTADMSTMSLENGMKEGDEVETFVSFFLSKPFGSDVQHRWNNIIIAENDGGYWNRFDVEYSFNDEMVGTVEYNKYWGDEDTMFGQFEDSSNLQLGFKYLF